MHTTITYCYIDGKGNEQVNHVSNEQGGGQVGYDVDEFTARVWINNENGKETKVFPLSRLVFIRVVVSTGE